MAIATAIRTRSGAFGVNRAIFKGIVLTAGLMIAGKVMALNLGAWSVRGPFPALLEQSARISSEAAGRAAEIHLAEGHVEEAEALARHALKTAPLSGRSLRTLGFSLQVQGQSNHASRAMTLAASTGWRDSPTQLWLLDAYWRQGDFDAALQRADAIARRGQMSEQMKASFIAAALEPAARAALFSRLANEPRWRESFFHGGAALPSEQLDAFVSFLRYFVRSGGTLRPDELEPSVTALFKRGEYSRALELSRFFNAEGREEAFTNFVLDGEFASSAVAPSASSGPFEWTFPRSPGSMSRIGEPPGRRGQIALFATSEGNERHAIATQVMVLPPGGYNLTAESAAEPGTAGDGFYWALDCLPKHQSVIFDKRTTSLSDGWARSTYSFELAGDGCSAQRLTLYLRGDERASVATWFDKISVQSAGES